MAPGTSLHGGCDIGPFELQSEAEAALTHYVEFARELEREIQEAYQEDALNRIRMQKKASQRFSRHRAFRA